MSTTNACPECGARVPSDAPLGLCPRCLMNPTPSPPSQTAEYRPVSAPLGAPAGPPKADRDELIRAIRDLDLAPADELERLSARVGDDPAQLARALVRAKRLTPHQAGAILQGKARGLVIGPYLVTDKLGEGGMGIVFKATHRPSGRVVALKILPPSFGRDADAVRRFHREFQIASRLSHPNLVAAIEANEDRGVHYLTMEYIPGYDLERLVARGGPMDVKLALHCIIHAARGLEAAHAQGVIHRDIKPGNLMIDPSGGVRVLDLGLARVIEATSQFGKSAAGSLTQTGSYMGTVDFLAPEQADDARSADARSDIYSLGCTLYFLLTAQPPFPGESVLQRLMAHQQRPAPSPRVARPEVSEALDSACGAMMSKKPADRPKTMSEVVNLLESCRTSAREAGDAGVDLQTFARTVMKRAARGGRRAPDASVFARPKPEPEPDALSFDPDLRLEDLVADYRPEAGHDPLPEDKLPPIVSRPLPKRGRRRNRSAPALPVALVLLVLAGGAYVLVDNRGTPRLAAPGTTLSAPTGPVPTPAPIATTLAEPGFRPLFDGSDLSGWEAKASNREDWALVDGVLTATGHGTARTQLLSPRAYGQFVARFEFQIEPGTNAGFLMVAPPGADRSFMEIGFGLADPRMDMARLWLGKGDLATDSIQANPMANFKPGLSWNAVEVEIRGGRLTTLMNGRPLGYSRPLGGLPGPRRLGFLIKDGRARFRNVEVLELDGATAAARPPRTIYLGEFDEMDYQQRDDRAVKGQARGAYFLETEGPGQWGPDNPGLGLPPFTVEAIGRVVGGGEDDQGSWGFQVPLAEDRLFRVWLNRQGEVWYEPNAMAPKDATGRPPRFGPFVSDAFRNGDRFNTLKIDMRPGRVEVSVNGRRVCGPLDVRWDGDIVKLMRFIGCASGRIRAEFDRIEVKELADAPPAAASEFRPLFNGKDLSGWTLDGQARSGWSVEDGALVVRDDSKGRNYLLTDRDFADFQLRFEFSLDEGAGSGVALRAFPGEKVPQPDGVLLFDHPIFKLTNGPRREPTGTMHWVFDRLFVFPDTPADMKPPGEWNQVTLEVRGHTVSASINGNPAHRSKSLAPGAKFPDGTVPALDRVKGRIGFQKHSGTVRFRDIEIRELP